MFCTKVWGKLKFPVGYNGNETGIHSFICTDSPWYFNAIRWPRVGIFWMVNFRGSLCILDQVSLKVTGLSKFFNIQGLVINNTGNKISSDFNNYFRNVFPISELGSFGTPEGCILHFLRIGWHDEVASLFAIPLPHPTLWMSGSRTEPPTTTPLWGSKRSQKCFRACLVCAY